MRSTTSPPATGNGQQQDTHTDGVPADIEEPESIREQEWPPEPAENSADGRPLFDAGYKDLSTVTPAVINALVTSNNPPTLFRYGNLPARIERDDTGMPVVRQLGFERLRHLIARRIFWFERKRVGKGDNVRSVEVPALPPRAVVEDVLATPDLPFPVLTRIVGAPVFAPDGTLQTAPGYHPATRTFYVDDGLTIPQVSEVPLKDEICDAADLLRELLHDFPFIGNSERAHALAVLLLPFVRDMVAGPTPFHLIEKPSPGTGATLLVDVLLYPALGRSVAVMTEGRDEDEMRKRIISKLRTGPAAVVIDNLRGRVDSAALSSVLTAWPSWEDRLLGKSEMINAPVRCVWVATGNNPALSNEIARRTVRIRLDAKVDRPWMRDGFKHPNLRTWVAENRGKLVWAALTLVRGWLAAGRPKGAKTIGMFERWAEVIGGILDVAGMPGCLANLDDFYEQSDAEGATWSGFVASWWERFGFKPVGVNDVFAIAPDELSLGDGKERSQKTRLGLLLRRAKDRIFTVKVGENRKRLCLEHKGTIQGAAQWGLVEK